MKEGKRETSIGRLTNRKEAHQSARILLEASVSFPHFLPRIQVFDLPSETQ